MSSAQKSSLSAVLLPGLHGTDGLYADLASQLEEVGLETNSINYPGKLTQSYPDLLEWLSEELDLTKDIIIIAESFSTPLALLLAEKFPTTIHAVVIAGGFCASPMPTSLALLPLRPLLMVTPPRSAIRLYLTGSDGDHEMPERIQKILKKVSSKTLSQRIRSILALEESDCPSIPETPVLLLQAQDDELIPWEIQNQLEQHLPHAETHWLDSPHLIYQTHPEASAQLIRNFIEEQLASTQPSLSNIS